MKINNWLERLVRATRLRRKLQKCWTQLRVGNAFASSGGQLMTINQIY